MKKAKGIKVLVSGVPKAGKSSLTSKLEDVLVFNFDYDKEYTFKIPYTTIYPHDMTLNDGEKGHTYKGMKGLKAYMIDIRNKYIKKFKKYPKTVVIDTATGFYGIMVKYNEAKYNGFDIHTSNNIDTETFNSILVNVFTNHGINVVIVAHTVYEESSGKYYIPAQGKFAKRGGWLSSVNNAIFLDIEDEPLVWVNEPNYPCRTLLDGYDKEIPRDEFNLQEFIDKIQSEAHDSSEYEL